MNPQRATAPVSTAAEDARLRMAEQEGWRYATELQTELRTVRGDLARANERIETLANFETRYHAVMEAYGKSRAPHSAPTAHDPTGCATCEARRRLDTMLAAYRVTQETAEEATA